MSKTTNLKLFKHDNPSTNTDKFDVDKALNDNWDKVDEAVGENIQNIGQLQQESTALKLENQRLREDIDNVIPSVSGSGESIRLNKTSNARFKKLGVKGNSKQAEYPKDIRSVGDNINLYSGDDLKTAQAGSYFQIPLQENKDYNISFKKSRIDGVTISNEKVYDIQVIRFYNSNGDLLSQINGTLYNLPSNSIIKISIPFITPANTSYAIILVGNNNGDNNINTLVSEIKVEKGSKATPYSKYGQGNINIEIANSDKIEKQIYTIPTQQPMTKIGDYQDTFVKQDGKWYEKHLIKEVILNGTENWTVWNISPQADTKAYVYRNFPSAIESQNQYAGCQYLSDSFLFDESNNYDYDKEILFINENNACGIRLDTDKASDLASFKKYLSDNNIAVYFIPKEPTYIECTQEQSDILDEIENTSHSYEGTTHILSTDEISPIFEVEALASLKALFEEVGN